MLMLSTPTNGQCRMFCMTRVCNEDGCGKPHTARGLCQMHYERNRLRGTLPPLVVVPLEDKIKSRVLVDENGCWIWQGAKDTSGYGLVAYRGRNNLKVHRAILEAIGRDLGELEVDHLCRVRACCNPDHLDLVTHHENMRRSPVSPTAINMRKTHCIHGHEFTPENTIIRKASGNRDCRECATQRQRRYRAEGRYA